MVTRREFAQLLEAGVFGFAPEGAGGAPTEISAFSNFSIRHWWCALSMSPYNILFDDRNAARENFSWNRMGTSILQ